MAVADVLVADRPAHAPRRVRGVVLAWMLGLSIAALVATVVSEVHDFRRQAGVLADRVRLLGDASHARGEVRRLVLAATRLAAGSSDTGLRAAAAADLGAAIAELRRSEETAVAPAPASTLPPLPTELLSAYYGPGTSLRQDLHELIASAEALATAPIDGTGRAAELLAYAGLAGARELLDRYDLVVGAYVTLLDTMVRDLRSLRYVGFLAAHLLLVAWIAFLYQWLLRRVRADGQLHRQVRLEAESRARELDAALGDLTRSRDEAQHLTLAMVSVLEDLSAERARLDREVGERRVAEERFRSVFEASPVGKLLVGPSGTILLANGVAAGLLGYAGDELIGQPVDVLVPARLRGGHAAHRRRFHAVPEARPMGAGRHLVAQRKDTSEVPVDIALDPIATAEGPGVLASVVDITHRVRSERALEQVNRELRRKNEELEQFVYTVSHDLKSPMVTISGFVGHIAGDAEGLGHAGIVDAARRVERACVRLRETLDDLLELSRAGRTVHQPERLEVRALLERVLEPHAAALAERGIQLDIERSLPMVEADPLRLAEVFDNLIANAIRYGCTGPSPVIRVGGARTEGEARFFVEDEGAGIPAEFQERVFGLFVRLAAGGEGSGVGLAIVRRIVEAHGGRTWVESPPAGRARGTRAWIAFTDPLLSSWQRRAAAKLVDEA
ncbi:MAG: PAS domain S-box protein [Deltaproteobacteria bacterium]|nr:PAS domain S-box protein [Deltaproteobacteria bacterium]